DDRYAFRHALASASMYEALLPGRRRALHRAYTQISQDPAQLERHALAGGLSDVAYRAALDAAAAAERVGSAVIAAAHLEVGLSWAEGDRVELLHRTALAHMDSTSFDRAVSLLGEALALVDPEAEPARSARLESDLGRSLWFAADPAFLDHHLRAVGHAD